MTGKIQLDPQRRYSVKEAASILGMSRKTLTKYTKTQDIKATVHAPTRRVYYLGRDIEKFFNTTI